MSPHDVASARGFQALMHASELAFSVECDPLTFAGYFRGLVDLLRKWLEAAPGSGNGDPEKRREAFLAWIPDERLKELDIVARRDVGLRVVRALADRPITDPSAELAAVRQAYDDAHDADHIQNLPTMPPDGCAGCAGSAARDWPTPEPLDAFQRQGPKT